MISSPGLGSNLDVNGIISQLMAVESFPLDVLDQQEGQFQAKLSALGQLKSSLATFDSAAKDLAKLAKEDAYSTTVGDTSIVTASASSEASEGSFSITVSQIAAAQSLVAAGQTSLTAAIGGGTATTVTIDFGEISGGTFDTNSGTYSGATFTANAAKIPLSIDLDGTNNTLEGIRDAINALDSELTASIINDGSGTPYRLAISSSATGIQNSLRISVSGEAAIGTLLGYDPATTQNLAQTQAAADASFNVSGIDITSPDNSASDFISGITLTLKATGTTTVSVARDTTDIRSSLEAIAKSYNDLNSEIAKATGLKAILQGDRAPISLQNRLRSALGESQADISSNFSTLSQLGLSFQRDGSLKFENATFQSALDTSASEVRALVGAFGTSLSLISEQLTNDTGPLNSRTEGINRSISDINDRRESFSRRLVATEARLRAQFTALDTLVSGLLSTSSFLTQQLANLPKIGGQNN